MEFHRTVQSPERKCCAVIYKYVNTTVKSCCIYFSATDAIDPLLNRIIKVYTSTLQMSRFGFNLSSEFIHGPSLKYIL